MKPVKGFFISRKSGPGPETKITFSGFLYSQKDKNARRQTESCLRRPETPSLWDEHCKSTTFQSNMLFLFFVFVPYLKKEPARPKTSRHRALRGKNDKCIVFLIEKPTRAAKRHQGKNDSRILGPTMQMVSVTEGTPSQPFFKK